MPRSRKRKSLWVRILGVACYCVFCSTVLFVGTAAGYLLSGEAGRSWIPYKVLGKTPAGVFGVDDVTLLILGCDEDVTPGGRRVVKAQARSDMMLVAKLDFKHRSVGGLSIPRDLLWEIPGYKRMKINAFHELGGNDLSKEAVKSLLGIDIDRVVSLDFDAFQELVTMVGGVELFVPKRMDYDDNAGKLHIHLKQGRQLLNGYNAMCFVRMRHSDSDTMRQERQRDFLIALKDNVVHKPLLIQQVASKVKDVLGGAFTMDELVALTDFAQHLKADNIRMGTLPTLDGPKGTGYGWYVDLDTSKLQDALRQFHLADAPTPASAPGR